ncbi:MAG: tetratricopeptide repeat protein [Desulfobacterales bacterium]|nr:MAG: tetratricopeptide repeat protein [Desulfobacterales bacterium]
MLTLSCRPSPSLVILQRADHQVANTILKKINELNAQGKYAEAIPLAKQLLEVVEKEKGPDHAGVAACLDVLGGLYTSFGDYGKAEPILKRALENHEKLEGKENPNVATSLGLLAKVYIELGDYSSALPLANRALQIREKMLGSDHFMVSTSLNTLGEIYLDLHEFEKAEPLFLRAIAIRKKHENPHGLVISLNNLSRLYYETHDYDAAEPLAVVALDLGTASLGEDHPHLAETLNVLGRIYAAAGKYEKSFDCLKRGQIIQLQSIDNMKGFTSEKQKLKYLAKMEEDLHVFLTLIANKLTQSYEAVKEGLNIVLKRKGIVLEVQKQFQRALVAGDQRALEIFQRLSETRAILSKMAFSGPGGRGFANLQGKNQ